MEKSIKELKRKLSNASITPNASQEAVAKKNKRIDSIEMTQEEMEAMFEEKIIGIKKTRLS